MSFPPSNLLRGRLAESGIWPLLLRARGCDLRPVFLLKGQVGRHHRAVSRNGRVLLASQLSLTELAGRDVQVRLQTWHKVILPGEPAEPYGLLLCVWPDETGERPAYEAQMLETVNEACALAVEVGGLRLLEFRGLAG
jgi:hypothetical protein